MNIYIHVEEHGSQPVDVCQHWQDCSEMALTDAPGGTVNSMDLPSTGVLNSDPETLLQEIIQVEQAGRRCILQA